MNSVEIIKRAAKSEKLNHAYLAPVYSGTNLRHYGSELAQEILCSPSEVTCRNKVIKNIHPDLTWLSVPNNKSKISINQVADIISSAVHAPTESQKRVYLIEKADDFSLEAANSMLKILEEPPEYVYFLMLTEDLDQLLDTIVSRCQQLPRGGLTVNGLSQLLRAEGFSEQQAEYLMTVVNNRADLADDLLSDCPENPEERMKDYLNEYRALSLVELTEKYCQASDLIEKDVVAKLFHQDICTAGSAQIIESVKLLKNRSELELRYLMTKGLLYWRKDLRATLSENDLASSSESCTESLRRADILEKAIRYISTNANVQLLLEATFLKLSMPGSSLVNEL